MSATYNTKHPVTVQEMDRVGMSIGFPHYNDSAMTKVCLIVRLGFDVTAETYQRELHAVERATDLEAAPLAEQVSEEIQNDAAWLDDSALVRNWQADAIAEAEFDADAKQTEAWSL